MSTTDADGLDGGLERALRLSADLSQDDLGKLLSVAFAQIQDHGDSDGNGGIGAGRLMQVSAQLSPQASSAQRSLAALASSAIPDLLATALSLRLLKAFNQIEDPAVREGFVRLIERTARGG